MEVLVTGGSGMIGSKFVSELGGQGHNVMYTYNTRKISVKGGEPVELDVTNAKSVMSLVEEFGPEIIIHCSALTKVDLCETEPSLADKINVLGTKNVIDACKNVDGKIIYISTSFVFDGKKKIYNETDQPHPINQYGLTKLRGEELTRDSGIPFMIVRTDHPYRWSPLHTEKNNIMRMIGLFERKEKFREATDWFNTPTLVDDLVETTIRLIRRWENGIYQVVGPDFISRYDLAMKVAEAVGGDKNLVKKAKAADFKLPTNRPNVHMSNEKTQHRVGLRMCDVEEGISTVLSQRKDSSSII